MQCSAHSRNGNQCRAKAVKGATVCRMHGGSAPQVKRAAEVRAARMQAHAEAERMVALAGVEADPMQHLLDSLYRAAALMAVWGQMVAALDAKAAEEAAEHDRLRGELGYSEAAEDSYDTLVVHSRDRLLALDRHSMAQVHPFVAEYQQALERRAKFAKLCIDAGIAERQVEIAEEQARLIADVIRGILTDLGVADRPEAPAVVRKHLSLVRSAAA
jgi:hypothetical protein